MAITRTCLPQVRSAAASVTMHHRLMDPSLDMSAEDISGHPLGLLMDQLTGQTSQPFRLAPEGLRSLKDGKPVEGKTCPFCPYTTARNDNLKKHIRIHTGEKPYVCPHCPFSCAQQQNLKSHMRKHTGENAFSCPSCDFKCNRRDKYISHIMTYHQQL